MPVCPHNPDFPSPFSKVNSGWKVSTDSRPARCLHLQPGGAQQIEILVEHTPQLQARLVAVAKSLAEEDVRNDVEGGAVEDEGGVERLAWKTGAR